MRPRSTAFFASNPAPTMTAGFEVFVHDVIAAITTEPWSRWNDLSCVRHLDGGLLGEDDAGRGRDGRIRSLLLVTWRGGRERVARREGLGDGLVVPVAVVDAEARERVDERPLRVSERHAILRPARPCERRLDGGEVEVDHLRVGRRRIRVVPERILLAVRLYERDVLGRPAGEPQIAQRLVVDGEEAARRAVLGRHVPDGRAVGKWQRVEPVPEVLDELPDDPGLAQDLRHGEDEIRRRRAFGERARQPEPDHLRHEHRDRLAEHRRLGFDPADAPAQHAESVDHRRVRVGSDERVGERDPVSLVNDASEELEVDLVDDPRARRYDLEVVEGALAPAQECVALAIPLELELGVAEDRESGSRTRRPAPSDR